MEKIYRWPSRAGKRLWGFTAVSIFIGALVLQAQDTLLSLGAGDVHKAVILVTKPSGVILELTYSKAKQAEFLKASQTGLPKKIQIALNGQMVSERTIAQPLSGHSIKVPMAPVDDAFARAVALMPLSIATSPAALPTDAPVFSVKADSISKFAVFMYNPGTVWIDVTLGENERALLAELRAKYPGGKILLSLDGKRVGELEIAAGNAGSSVRVLVSSVGQARAVTDSLMGKNGKSD